LDLRYLVVAGDVSIDVLWQHFENLFQKKVGARSSISLNAQRADGVARFCGRHNRLAPYLNKGLSDPPRQTLFATK